MSKEEKQPRNLASKPDRDNSGRGQGRTPRKKFYRKNKHKTTSQGTFKGDVEGIKEHTFVWSQLRTKKWITSREKFIDYASRKYG